MDNTSHCINNIYYFLNSSNDTRKARFIRLCIAWFYSIVRVLYAGSTWREHELHCCNNNTQIDIFHLIVREMNCAWRGICCALFRRYYICIYNSCKIEICLQFTWIVLRDMFALIEDMTTQFARRCIRSS